VKNPPEAENVFVALEHFPPQADFSLESSNP